MHLRGHDYDLDENSECTELVNVQFFEIVVYQIAN